MQYLSQRDLRWASTKLGNSTLTVGRYGCTTVCISMLSDYFGSPMTPNQIANSKTWYTNDGLILWNMLSFKKMKVERLANGNVKRLFGRDDAEIKKSLDDPNKGVILQVNDGAHWILPIRKTWFTNDYHCVDPWTGKTCTAIGDYKNITGSAHFMRIS